VTSAAAPQRYRGVLFDLFGTLVFFARTGVPTTWAAGATNPSLEQVLALELPRLGRDEFAEVVRAVSREIADERRHSHVELSSPERFRRVLVRLGIDDPRLAERLCLAHMSGLAALTEVPPDSVVLLRRLAARLRLGLVSNFDHGPTARGILARHGLAELLDPIVISDDFGWRKPRPDIFLHGAARLGVSPPQVLFVGDTPVDDIDGARRAGFDAAWLNPRGDDFPPDLLPPTFIVRDLAELCAVLEA
jgi:HAD superfamily hydrolase (TIGR01549 family)